MSEKRWVTIVSLVIILFVGFGIINKYRQSKDVLVEKTNYIMGTIIKLKLPKNVDEEIFDETFGVIRDIEKKMSLNIKNSELNELNENGFNSPVELSDETKYVIEKSIDYSKLSDGHFDVSIGPLADLWGFSKGKAKVPNAKKVLELLPLVDYKNIEVKDEKVKLNKEGMILDLGGIAKGYAADEVAKYLKTQGVNKAIIDLGGNIYALGSKDKSTPWTIGIQNPFDEVRGEFLGTLSVSNKSVVTSGVYERYIEEGGKKYHHILDPFTGYPVENELMSVSIISDESIDGDALSTAVFALGLEKGYELVKTLTNVEAIFVTKDKDVYLTDHLIEDFKMENTDFSLKTFK